MIHKINHHRWDKACIAAALVVLMFYREGGIGQVARSVMGLGHGEELWEERAGTLGLVGLFAVIQGWSDSHQGRTYILPVSNNKTTVRN